MERESELNDRDSPGGAAGPEQKRWLRRTHERKVENFYGRGAERYTDFHNGYLNFGLWDNGIKDYVAAAENLVRRLGEIARLNPDSRLLDVACGMGTQDIFLLRHFAPSQIDAVDVTWKHVEHGRRRARQFGCEDRVQFHHGTATELRFPASTFTNVISIEGPVHFDSRERFMKEALRVLKPGGVLAMSDYILKRRPRGLVEKLTVDAGRRMWKIPLANMDSAKDYQAKLARAGFTNIELNEIGAQVIPGYYFEQMKPETIRALSRIRGRVRTRLGLIIDKTAYRIFNLGLLEYVFVSAEKPAS